MMQGDNVTKRFRYIAIAEGISMILLLFIAMPLKYWADMPLAVKYTGWAHGILFMAYIVFMLEISSRLGWNFGRTALAFGSSLVPFGPFLFDRYILKK
jgi:integral membrane protein